MSQIQFWKFVSVKWRTTLGIGDDGALDAGLARNVKPHIDLKMKLHKKLKEERPARTEAE